MDGNFDNLDIFAPSLTLAMIHQDYFIYQPYISIKKPACLSVYVCVCVCVSVCGHFLNGGF